MDQKRSSMEPRCDYITEARRTTKIWEDNINEVIRNEYHTRTESNELGGNTTWLEAGKGISK